MINRSLPRLFLLSVGVLLLTAVLFSEELRTEHEKRGEPETKPGDGEGGAEGGEADLRGIVDTAAAAGRFGTFGVALKTAGLVEALEAPGPFNVFAPTDEAFAKLGETLDELLANKDGLAKVLKLHVVEGTINAEDLAGKETLTSLEGSSLRIDASDGITVNGSKVVERDLLASNGVIHGIDTLLSLDEPEPTPA